ncbi:hypothetical protein PV11_05764 [Exophiala sideris]|uniref:Uncharacterized protein n=1 Tax=Exophiala sideris TaxID=1016849 RepID=A0A0D1YQW0_9EURO|nr:hypothetical protein PV11_05764 [Exophiala sideris]
MAALGPWFIPITVTLGGFLLGNVAKEDPFTHRPSHSTPKDTIVRMWAGMDANKSTSQDTSLAGATPQVVLYDERGDHIGDTWPDKNIPEGGFFDFIVTPDVEGNNVRPTYMQINHVMYDALCISAIQVQYAEGGSSTIYGDIPAKFCGWASYPSITQFRVGSDGKEIYQPWCFWMDGNDSGNPPWEGATWTPTDHFAQSVNLHIPDFDGQPDVISAYQANRDLICNSEGRLQAHPWVPETISFFRPPLSYGNTTSDLDGVSHEKNNLDPNIVIDDFVGANKWPQSSGNPHFVVDYEWHWNWHDFTNYKKRSLAAREASGSRHGKLYAVFESDDPTLSADYVCSQRNVFGPHYANAQERKFCNLDDRTVWPFCDDTHTTNCFDMESHTLWGDASAPAGGSVGTFGVGSEAVRTAILSLDGRSTLGL